MPSKHKKKHHRLSPEISNQSPIKIDFDQTEDESKRNLPKKRGRKPKSYIEPVKKILPTQSDDEDEKIIVQIPLQVCPSDKKSKKNNSGVTINDLEEDEIQEDDSLTLSSQNNCDKCTRKKEKIIALRKEIKTLKKNMVQDQPLEETTVRTKKPKYDIYNITNKKKYKKKSKHLLCWYCSLPMQKRIHYMVFGLPEFKQGKKYYCLGIFNSLRCALAYNLKLNDYKIWERTSYLKALYHHFIGKTLTPAPPKECMKKYGGILTEEEYVDLLFDHQKLYKMIFPPIAPIIPYIESDQPISAITENNLSLTQNQLDQNDLVETTVKPKKRKKKTKK